MDHAIVGFELLGDPVLGGEFVAFQDGLNVLYGLNGAGKTRLLTGMRNALRGISSDTLVGLIVRVQAPTEADIASDNDNRIFAGLEQRRSGAGLLLALADQLGGPKDRDRYSGYLKRNTISLPAAFKIVQDHLINELQGWFPPEGAIEINTDELESELLDDRLFLLLPDGEIGTARWHAWPVADRRGAAIARWEQLWAMSDDPSLLNEDECFELQERLYHLGLGSAGESYYLQSPSHGWIVSNHFAFYGSSVSTEIPPIVLTGDIDFGVDVADTQRDAEVSTLEFLSRTAISTAWATTGHKFDDLIPEVARQIATGAIDTKDLTPGEREGQLDEAVGVGERAAREVATELARDVNAYLTAALLDPPTASIEFTSPLFRFSMPAARWRFRHTPSGPAVDLTALSSAEKKWASLAILLAVGQRTRRTQWGTSAHQGRIIMLVDEPEAALHRAAEARAAEFLQQLSKEPAQVLFIVTHSPELLDLPDASLIEIVKDKSSTPTSLVQRLNLADRKALLRLGLRPSDLLRWPRVFLLVEGLHDQLVLEGYFGDRLRASRIEILPLRGATKLPNTVDSRVLFKYTDATVVALLDNISSDAVRECWDLAQSTTLLEGVEAGKQVIVNGIAGQSEESRFLREWLTSAIDNGLESRLMPIGLSARDVIEYLPVALMVPGAPNWEALRREHAEERESGTGIPGDFKKWLSIRKQIDVNESLIRLALESASSAPSELERLMKTLEAVSSQPRTPIQR
ncbi:MAG: AAA family ATPase [Kineosporiaceae bacterium]|nr:AAA family ATPase [Aeromicrobium sp.]